MPPHDSWARYYDLVYETMYGPIYEKLTELTLRIIRRITPPGGSIIDFGAGTGRLAIPLARDEYVVTAVEPSRAMLDVLNEKAKNQCVRIPAVCQTLQNYNAEGQFDSALCVFTTISYILNMEGLRLAVRHFSDSVQPGGRVFFDIPGIQSFQNHPSIRCPGLLERNIRVTPQRENIYTYHEETSLRVENEWKRYEDEFQIRYWAPAEVLDLLQQNGIGSIECETGFEGTGLDCYSGRKKEQGASPKA